MPISRDKLGRFAGSGTASKGSGLSAKVKGIAKKQGYSKDMMKKLEILQREGKVNPDHKIRPATHPKGK